MLCDYHSDYHSDYHAVKLKHNKIPFFLFWKFTILKKIWLSSYIYTNRKMRYVTITVIITVIITQKRRKKKAKERSKEKEIKKNKKYNKYIRVLLLIWKIREQKNIWQNLLERLYYRHSKIFRHTSVDGKRRLILISDFSKIEQSGLRFSVAMFWGLNDLKNCFVNWKSKEVRNFEKIFIAKR